MFSQPCHNRAFAITSVIDVDARFDVARVQGWMSTPADGLVHTHLLKSAEGVLPGGDPGPG